MNKTTQLYEGKAKKVFLTEDSNLVIQEFKDDATAFNNKKKGTIADKGVVNNSISCKLFTLLEKEGIHTHLVEKLSDRDMLCRHLDIIKVEVVVRNIAAGSLVKRYGFAEGTVLAKPIVEFYLKDDDLDDPLMNESHAVALGVATLEELAVLKNRAEAINAVLKKFFLTEDSNLVIQEFKDDATAFNNKKKGTIADKGVVNNSISCKLFTLLEKEDEKCINKNDVAAMINNFFI